LLDPHTSVQVVFLVQHHDGDGGRKSLIKGKENYTQDGTVDLKGWKACSFIAGKMEPFAAYFEAD